MRLPTANSICGAQGLNATAMDAAAGGVMDTLHAAFNSLVGVWLRQRFGQQVAVAGHNGEDIDIYSGGLLATAEVAYLK